MWWSFPRWIIYRGPQRASVCSFDRFHSASPVLVCPFQTLPLRHACATLTPATRRCTVTLEAPTLLSSFWYWGIFFSIWASSFMVVWKDTDEWHTLWRDETRVLYLNVIYLIYFIFSGVNNTFTAVLYFVWYFHFKLPNFWTTELSTSTSLISEENGVLFIPVCSCDSNRYKLLNYINILYKNVFNL